MHVISREDCGLLAPTDTPAPMRAPTGLVVHCTAGTRPRSCEHALEVWRSTQRFHMGAQRGWDDIGYSFGFTDLGQLLEGRGWMVRGAHSGPGWNASHHGIAYLGSGKRPTELALQALEWWIGEHDRRYGVGEVLGHRDIANKGCPGQGIYDWMVAHYGDRNPKLDPECATYERAAAARFPTCGQG